MALHFNCPPISDKPASQPLVFSWDPEAGTVTGPDAAQVAKLAKPGAHLPAQPPPWGVVLGPDPLRSWRDMAVVVGTSWRVPPESSPNTTQPRQAPLGTARCATSTGTWSARLLSSGLSATGHPATRGSVATSGSSPGGWKREALNPLPTVTKRRPGAEVVERWSSPAYLVFAATGTAAGLGALWLFPSLVQQHGGGAFVLAYLAAMLLVGLPLLLAELSLGRLGGPDPLRAFGVAHRQAPAWSWAGLPITLTGALALSVCGVFGGWALDFAWNGLAGQADRGTLSLGPLAGQALFMAVTAAIVGSGMRRGIERALRWIVPALFALLLALVSFAMVTSDRFGQSVALLGVADFSRLGASGMVAALGLALLTVAAGCGVMPGLGAHACRATSLVQVAVTVVVIDVAVALLAALAIFPVVLGTGARPADGAALLFVTLPPAFAATAGGGLLAAAFFTSVALAALTGCVSLLGPIVGMLHARLGLARRAAAALVAAGCWIPGAVATVLLSAPG